MPLFPMRYDGLQVDSLLEQASVETATTSGDTLRLRCFCQQMGHQRLRSERGFEYVATLAYFCPSRSPQQCALLRRRDSATHSAQPLNISLTTAYHHNGQNSGYDVRQLVWKREYTIEHKPQASYAELERAQFSNYFLLNVLPALPVASAGDVVPTVAAITTICYGSAYNDRQSAMNIVSKQWVAHYRRLNFRVVLYDVVGQRTDFADTPFVDYHPYSILSILGVTAEAGGGAPKYDPSTKYVDKLHLLYDSDKINTYTHSRFEMAAVYDMGNTLIIDFDEFLYCKNGLSGSAASTRNTYENQIKKIDQLLLANKESGNEIALSDLVPHQRVDMPIQACMRNMSEVGESIFSCISSIDHAVVNSPKLKKGLHTVLACPYTHFHNAGLFHRDINPYWCEGPITYPNAQICTMVHFEFKVLNRYLLNTVLSPNELASLV